VADIICLLNRNAHGCAAPATLSVPDSVPHCNEDALDRIGSDVSVVFFRDVRVGNQPILALGLLAEGSFTGVSKYYDGVESRLGLSGRGMLNGKKRRQNVAETAYLLPLGTCQLAHHLFFIMNL